MCERPKKVLSSVALSFQWPQPARINCIKLCLLGQRFVVLLRHFPSHTHGTVVSSSYYTRLRQSRVYIGYIIATVLSDSVFYSKNPRVQMNPYCPSYYDGVSSVNGGDFGGDQNVFRAAEGFYTREGEEYLYSCHQEEGQSVAEATELFL